MGIKQKFFLLAGIIGIIMAIVSCIGYYTAYSNLEDSVEKEISATIEVQGQGMDGWLREKAAPATAAANLMTELDGREDLTGMHEMMSLASSDKEIKTLTNGNEKGLFMSWASGNRTGQVDPKQRPWYLDAKKAGKMVFTDAYKDVTTGKLVVSAAAPYFGKSGQFAGAICEDISMDVLQQRVQDIKYRGEGTGIIIEKTGKILATAGDEEALSDIRENADLKNHFDEMLQNKSGYFFTKKGGTDSVFAYTTASSAGWIIGISVPQSFVFAAVSKLKFTYAILTILSILCIVFVSLRFSGSITKSIVKLHGHASELAKGNLQLSDLSVESSDELGTLTASFNAMNHNLRDLIRRMATTSEQVAASSEELTASAQQSAEASNHVAVTVSQVSEGSLEQLKHIDGAKKNVDAVFNDITKMADKARHITETSAQTAAAAQKGETLMQTAVNKMGLIETSVMESAEVVRKLGENSQQIGQIVDTISAISEQTNLLALNAAIEAARAGEHGRGFSVVAEEVRKLAAESQTSAEQIKERIASIQASTGHAVASMQNGTQNVQEGTSSIREVGTQFTDIMGMVNEIKSQIDGINASVKTVSSGAKHIVEAVNSIDNVSRKTAENTQTISAATEEQSASTEEIASASHALAQMAAELQEATGKFKL